MPHIGEYAEIISSSGTIGPGAFTTLSASSSVNLSPANANVSLSPTGTGFVTINPATLGSIDKVAIGGTTPAAASVTTLTASAAVTLSPANSAVILSPTGTGIVTVNPATTGAMDNINIGAITPKPGAFTTLGCTVLTASANSVINTVKIGTANTSNFYVDATNAAIRPFDSAAGAGVYIQNSAGTVTWSVTTVD